MTIGMRKMDNNAPTTQLFSIMIRIVEPPPFLTTQLLNRIYDVMKRICTVVSLAIFMSGPVGMAQRLGANFGDPEEYRDIPLATGKMRGVLPPKVDLSGSFPRAGDQGNQGSCVGWAVAYGLKGYLEKKERGWAGNNNNQLFSPAYIYNQINDGVDEGANIAEALDLLMREGVATLAAFPYSDTNFTTQPSATAKEGAREFAIASFRRLNTEDRASQVRNHLADGFPVIIGMRVGRKFKLHRGDGTYSAPESDPKEGGHAMCTVGYDDERRAFKVINSWSTKWGNNGFGWVSYDTFTGKVSQAFVVQDVVVYKPEPSPDTPPSPPVVDFDPVTPDSPWIFPDSSRRKLSPSELRVRSSKQLWRSRNEIYARHGYMFSSDRGKSYTRLLGAHYKPRTGDSSKVEGEFNQIEEYNIALIKSFEVSRPNPVGPQPNNPWVFADSSARRLNVHEVQRLGKEHLWRARNEIFARNGYIFTSAKGKAFAKSMGPLYVPRFSDMTKVYESFDSIEEYNVKLIKRFE
jgi:hypothetical protein